MAHEIGVLTNSYEIVRLPTATYHHYDVIIEPETFKRVNFELIDRLQVEHAAIFNPRAVYDGRKNLFCTREIPISQFEVALTRKKSFKVFIKRVNIISPSDVQKLTRRRSPGDVSDNAMPLNLLQLIVRQAPNMRHKFPSDARSFYIAHNAKDLRIGISAWRGYFQSVRPVLGKLIINVDVSHAAVYTPGYLVDTMMAHLGLRDARELTQLNNIQQQQLRLFLKGVLVKVNLGNSRPRPIKDFVPQGGLQEFDKDGERWTVQRHFEHKYNCQVRNPRFPGVRIGSTAIVPAEFCIVVPGQLYRKKIPPHVQKDFLGFSTQKPDERMRAIRSAVAGPNQLFDYGTSDFMQEAGMAVSQDTMSVRGVVIPPPQIQYRGHSMTIPPRAGAWNVVGKQFAEPATLRFWSVAVFGRAKLSDVQDFISTLGGNLGRADMTVHNPTPPIFEGNPADPCPTLMQCAKASIQVHLPPGSPPPRPQLIVVILPESAEECRRVVKHWGDIEKHVPTQCVRTPKWIRAKDQYCNNVALKINARLGGTNSYLNTDAQEFLRTSMVIGADVGHPGPGAVNRPSITGLVASVDPAISKMTSFVNVQTPRQEIIEDLEPMMIAALGDYREYQKSLTPKPAPPKTVVFYRDGVSEGEFAQVAAREIPLIKSAFVKCGLHGQLTPRLIFIVVGKRHHVRFFPQNPGDSDRSGNCPAGLLVDKELSNPNYLDFYLQSHAGLLGTSRPAHYVVLENEANVSRENLQKLTFHLCHAYASATRSVSIPAPVYYADRICSRMTFHFAEATSLSDTASNVTGANPEFDLDFWKRAFRPSGLNKRMYFL
ncbi:Piwi domain-containing protein [Trametes polyzona]|nr:Piwi domain-containing protein [Trametes polyzona]